ncbi:MULTISPECIES: factor H binding protein domain-containing protein [unclassified Neisseria]|uniref:factor H binding protein domain-containing protein n=1 Tax=unclassified Neisseria TaxID=2623750 RepID=UPI0026667940|nr:MULTISPECIES: factor H binding protein domain-containing protein [unclassified Neisseria]MDO1510959.1 factor H binding family protein [Neisseria sp. MVDL19-042950]MDO1517201.1 factor H binding family protein [Neisseria sp. MVDL18-041461]MDO1564564.1 factor H binding family protein [Neisseria sp. MVDL20-010259]
MHVKYFACLKASIVIFTVCGLAACGSGGGDDKPVTTSTTTTSTSSSTTTTGNSQFRRAQNSPTSNQQAGNNTSNQAANLSNLTPRASKPTHKKAQNYSVTINGHTHKGGGKIVLDDFQKSNLSVVDSNNGGTIRAYRQNHSIIAGYLGQPSMTTPQLLTIGLIKGDFTETLPTQGTYTYQGTAFSGTETGKLDYSVNFDKRTGSGKVSGFKEISDIALKEGNIGNLMIDNKLDGSGLQKVRGIVGKTEYSVVENGNRVKREEDYRLVFFGPNAEEIGGKVFHSAGEIGIAGKVTGKK